MTAPLLLDRPAGSGSGSTPLRLRVGAPSDVLAAARRRGVLLPDAYYGMRDAQARSMAFTVAGVSALEQLQAVKDSLDAAFKAGDSFTAWKRRVLRGDVPLTLPSHRIETIFRTNMQAVTMAGRGAQMLRNADTHPYLLYSAVNDSRTRPAHRRMHGTILPIRDPWWSTHRPPCGYNCRCNVIALTEAEARRRGITTLPPAAQPDPGFEYDPWADVMAGPRRAIEKFERRADPKLGRLAREVEAEALRALPNVRTLDDALARGREETLRLLGRVADGRSTVVDLFASRDDAERFAALLAERIREVHGAPVAAEVFRAKGMAGAAKTVKEASARYPASWVAATNRFGQLTVQGSNVRGGHVSVRAPGRYKIGRAKWEATANAGFITIPTGGLRTALHEFGHRIQAALPDLDRLFQDYHARRTAGEPLQRLRDLVPGAGYGPGEKTRPDKWMDAYFGKVYDEQRGTIGEGALEMLTMTLERMLDRDVTALRLLYQRDRELFELAVGVLTGWAP